MNKKVKIIVIFLIIILILFVGFLTYYKLTISSKSEEYIIVDIKDEHKNINLDISKYEEYFSRITKDGYLNIEISNDSGSLKGKIQIKDSYLSFEEDETMKTIDLLDKKVISYVLSIDDENEYALAFAATEENDLYRIDFNNLNVDDIEVTQINNNLKVKAVTSIETYSYQNEWTEYLVVLGTDDKLYYMPSEALYDEESILVNNKYILYKDKSISTIDGRIIKGNQNKEILVKYIFTINNDGILENNPEEILITNDGYIAYVVDNQLYIYNKKIESIDFYGENDTNSILIKYSKKKKMKFTNVFYDPDYYDINYGRLN